MQIYSSDKETIENLLKEAGSADGARLLIPDLQRPYQWTPQQVVALLDSLLRGWPFGTLLIWDLDIIREQGAVDLIPSREFWQFVDRRPGQSGKAYPRATLPARYRMVLDGQQRLQSLLLAVQGDDAGFLLPDHLWRAELRDGARSRSTAHWSWGQLCLDLDAFSAAYVAGGDDPGLIDFQAGSLIWVACNAERGVSPGRKPNQPSPIETIQPSKHIRLSRLWRMAPSRGSWGGLQKPIQALMEEHGVAPDKRHDVGQLLMSFCNWLGALKDTEITFLKVKPLEDQSRRDQYDQAVVTIFTRLNNGGTPLSAQEIMFAWIKRKWSPSLTSFKDADQCFEELRLDLERAGVFVGIDELVRAVSALWSVCENGGQLLGNAEFRRGHRIAELAPWLAARWEPIRSAFLQSASALESLGLEQDRHFESTNSVFVLAAWLFALKERSSLSKDTFLTREARERRASATLHRHVIGWMLIPQWAGVWRNASSFSKYTADLGRWWTEALSAPDLAEEKWSTMLAYWIDEARKDAADFVETVRADQRNTVRRYHSMFWAWQFLDRERGELSQIALKLKSKKETTTHVDHIVSYDFWAKTLSTQLQGIDIDDLEDGPNALGNCMLLNANFNTSKSAEPLCELLAQVQEFRSEPVKRERWCKALEIAPVMLDAREATIAQVRAATAARSASIRQELLRFVRGAAALQAPMSAETSLGDPTPSPFVGRWRVIEEEGEHQSRHEFELSICQQGRQLMGSYGDGKKLTAEATGRVVSGEWTEGVRRGSITLTLNDEGDFFHGEWTWSRTTKSGIWGAMRIIG